tara:strand:- start:1062 stop:1490 length:429 start_codon:yes stop_codon:yes gene_type:complete
MPLIKSKRLPSGLMLKRYHLPHTELAIAGTAQTIPVVTLPADACVVSVSVDLLADFTDAGSISNVTLQVGSTADPNSYFTALEVMASSPANKRYEQRGAWEAGDGLAIKCLATATGANFGNGSATDLDAGTAEIDIIYYVAQ